MLKVQQPSFSSLGVGLSSTKEYAMTQAEANPSKAGCDEITVMFDGSCPLCRREIALYQSLDPLQPVVWRDISQENASLSQADQARYMARFHVQLDDGRQLSGAAAFVKLWQVMPGWRWLGAIGRMPGVTPILELAYRGFLHLRPHLQRWARLSETGHK